VLQLFFSATGSGPFTALSSVVNSLDNTVSATISQAGFLYVGDVRVFADGFEPPPP